MSDRFVISVKGVPLVSTNDAYIPTYKGKHCFYRKSKEMNAFQEAFSAELAKYSEAVGAFVESLRQEHEHLGIKLALVFVMPRDMYYYKRKADDLRPHDTSNYIKAAEDQISRLLGIDDKYDIQVSAVKCFSDSVTENPDVYAIIEGTDYMKYSDSYVLDFYGIGQEHGE